MGMCVCPGQLVPRKEPVGPICTLRWAQLDSSSHPGLGGDPCRTAGKAEGALTTTRHPALPLVPQFPQLANDAVKVSTQGACWALGPAPPAPCDCGITAVACPWGLSQPSREPPRVRPFLQAAGVPGVLAGQDLEGSDLGVR